MIPSGVYWDRSLESYAPEALFMTASVERRQRAPGRTPPAHLVPLTPLI